MTEKTLMWQLTPKGATPAGGWRGAHAEMVTKMDSFIESTNGLDEPVVVHRGLRKGASFEVGDTVTDRGYMSTTVAPEVVKKTFSGKAGSARLELTVPRGYKAAYLPAGKRDGEPMTGFEREYELLLPRNTRFKVIGKEKSGGVTVYRGEVIP